VAGLVFAVHPVHVEAVANVVGMAEILSCVAILLACLVHVRGPAVSSWPRALAVGVLYALAFGAKESGVTLPGLILLLDAARQRLGFADLGAYLRDRWRVYAVMALVAAALIGGRLAILGSVANPFPPLGAGLLTEVPRIWTLAEVWTHYVRLWVFPLDLYSDYAPNVIPIALSWHAENVVGAVMAAAVLGVALLAWRRPDMAPGTDTSRAAGLGVVWFVIAIAPVSNALFLTGVLLAERTLYLPSVGLALATGWLVFRLARTRPRGAWILLGLAMSLSVARTWTRTPTWRDNEALFSTLVRDAPQAGRSQWILGDEFLEAGMISEGLRSYRLAISLLDGHYTLLVSAAERLIGIGRDRAAANLLVAAYRSEPGFSLAPSLLAMVLAERGDARGTEQYARAALAVNGADVSRQHLLAWSLAAQGRWVEAREARRRAEELGRSRLWHQWMYQAYARRNEGDTVGALAAVDSAWAATQTDISRATLDSARVADFGLVPLLSRSDPPAPDSVNR
jgi:tetratricopeptide (TPR) repeat protein